MAHRVLFVDHEPNVTKALKRSLRKEPYEFLSADSADAGLRILESQPVDVVVSDEQMPGMSGSEFLAIVCQRYPDTVRMILTGHARLESAIKAINEGQIYRFFTKPCNPIDLAVTIRQALQQKDLMAESRRLVRIARRQSAVLEDVGTRHPELMDLKKDATGRIVIEEEECDFDTLIEQISEARKRSEAFFVQSEGR